MTEYPGPATTATINNRPRSFIGQNSEAPPSLATVSGNIEATHGRLNGFANDLMDIETRLNKFVLSTIGPRPADEGGPATARKEPSCAMDAMRDTGDTVERLLCRIRNHLSSIGC
jgi:hypothetical protein